MSSLPAALNIEDCLLLIKYGGSEAGELIARFNAIVVQVRELSKDRQLTKLMASERMAVELDALMKVRVRLSLQRFVVGCIGVTQAGKSSLINCIIGQEVCKEGAMTATSSQPSRIIQSESEKLEVVYLTRDEFETRRQALCEAINLPTPPPDAELLALLEKPNLFEKDEKGKPLSLPRLVDDVAYLKEFLRSRAKNAEVIQAQSVVDSSIPFEHRYEVTAHGGKILGDKSLLLKEACFYIRCENLPEELELCDLPGLGSKRSVDDVVTRSYLEHLDGVFLFASLGENPLKEEMLKILQELGNAFRKNLSGRAWVLFTKMDTLTENVYDAKSNTIFDTMQEFLSRTGMSSSQACLCSKELWNLHSKGKLTEEAAAERLKQTASQPVPKTCPPEFQPAWMELLKDGGVTHVRRLMFQGVAEALAKQIRQDVSRALDKFEHEVQHLVESERRKRNGGAELFQRAMVCYSVILQLRVGLTTKPADFPILIQQSEQLKRKLSAFFDDPTTVHVVMALSPAELANQFHTHARYMNATLDAEISGEILDQVYQFVGQRLDGLPSIEIQDAESCSAAWQRFRIADRSRNEWQNELPTFDDSGISDWIQSAGDALDGEGYVELMRDKIDIATKQAVQVIRSRLRNRLGEIERDLALLINDEQTATP